MNSINEQSPRSKHDEAHSSFPSILETEQPMLQSLHEKRLKDTPPRPTSIHDLLFSSRDPISPPSQQERFTIENKNDKDVPRTLKRSNTADLHSYIIEEGSVNEASPVFTRKAKPSIMLKKSEELSRSAVFDSDHQDVLKEPASAGLRTFQDDMGTSLRSDITTSKKKGILKSKPVTISLTFDAFMDQIKGLGPTSLFSNYPSHKIDKRLIFLGKELDYPWHIISYHSTFRKLWNLFIVALIFFEIFWYPLAATFMPWGPWPLGLLIFEVISIPIFFLDILINLRTTYSNENNEEIIDAGMMRKNYLNTKLFYIDVVTVLPIPEILLITLISAEEQWLVYSMCTLVRMLRVFKIQVYLQNQVFSILAKLLRIFIWFFIAVHWVTCLWYLLIKADYTDPPQVKDLWFPNTTRMIADDDEDLLAYYFSMETIKVYGLTLLSVIMLAVGGDMAPQGDMQIWVTILIGLFGAATLAYIFGLVILSIDRATRESQLYHTQNEELKQKLKINKIPHNLRVKIMEYFYYSWRKHRILNKMDDFSELSLPLQRDLALYQHQEMILKVPLFKELDPIEILSIVQKLKTAIYMPGDKIIREGERGTEMFFIQEGIAEKLIKKTTQKVQTSKANFERILLKKGNYFGEVALMSNSKRLYDVNAYEFCILYTFSRNDYNSLKIEFKDIGPRLRSGLKHYKNTHMASLIQILKNLNIFHGFRDHELQRIGDEYLEEVFVDPDKVVLAPKERTNAIYVVLGGKINCYADNEETRNYLSHLKRSNDRDNWTVVDIDEEEDVGCLDDDILKLEKDKLSMEDDKKKLELIKTYNYGEYFGTLDFDVNEIRCNKYFVTDAGSQIGAITQSLKSQMEEDDPILYEKLKANIIKFFPKRVIMNPIEEESDSSFTTKNNTIIKTRLSKRLSLNDFGKKPRLLKIMSLNQGKEEDAATVKEDLAQLESEINRFRGLVANINSRLGRIASNYYKNIKSFEGSPDKLDKKTNLTKQSAQFIEQIKAFDKYTSNKELARDLLGVDEVDQAEETKSITKD